MHIISSVLYVNLKLVCTTGYLTGTTDLESVLQPNSMELTINLNKTASSKIFNHLFCTQNVFLSLHFMCLSFNMKQNSLSGW